MLKYYFIPVFLFLISTTLGLGCEDGYWKCGDCQCIAEDAYCDDPTDGPCSSNYYQCNNACISKSTPCGTDCPDNYWICGDECIGERFDCNGTCHTDFNNNCADTEHINL